MFNRRYALTLVVLLFVAWRFVFLDIAQTNEAYGSEKYI